MQMLGSRSLLGVPLLRDGRVVGSITLGRAETGGFNDDEVALVQSFAEQAVIAIASAETFARCRSAPRHWPSATANTASGSSSSRQPSTC